MLGMGIGSGLAKLTALPIFLPATFVTLATLRRTYVFARFLNHAAVAILHHSGRLSSFIVSLGHRLEIDRIENLNPLALLHDLREKTAINKAGSPYSHPWLGG